MTQQYTLHRWAIRQKSTGYLMPLTMNRHTQAEPTGDCIPRLFESRAGAASALSRWLEGVWSLSYYRTGEYGEEIDVDWGPSPPTNPRNKDDMEVVEVELLIRVAY